MSFGSVSDTTIQIANFPTAELKAQYISDEYKSLSCQNAYKEFQIAWTKEERVQALEKLNNVRWAFFRKWAAKHLNKDVRDLTEDDIPA